ncbi:UTP--glucose-1-phosphate uridylyltransferase GalU [Lentisphaerota bacterium ZTH]|nr:UTP--glucose-1-phosphate uridylyltransferase GalU [Lentisphaerota bacterium]WET07405.1 UTP--glucose-1-phosphate uridylyltransferase GalU [Lentisphaerota bacterium ZTH]
MIKKAVIPAAGFGTRFLPFTKAVPKEMIPLIDKPVIQYVIEEAAAAGITEILVVVSRGKMAIQEHFNPEFSLEDRLEKSGKTSLLEELRRIDGLARLHFVYQQELKGLGDAVLQAKSFVGNDPFAVLLGDTVLSSDYKPVTSQLLDVYADRGAAVVALEEVPQDLTSRYGVIAGTSDDDSLYEINGLVEKPAPGKAPSNLVIASRYIFTADIFDYLEKTPRGKGNEIQLTDAMRAMLADKAMYGLKFNGTRHDIGNKLDFIISTIEFALKSEEFRQPVTDYLKSLEL